MNAVHLFVQLQMVMGKHHMTQRVCATMHIYQYASTMHAWMHTHTHTQHTHTHTHAHTQYIHTYLYIIWRSGSKTKINSVLSFFGYAILPSTIARGIDWVGVRADTLVPLMAVMVDLRRLKDCWQHSHHMVVQYICCWPTERQASCRLYVYGGRGPPSHRRLRSRVGKMSHAQFHGFSGHTLSVSLSHASDKLSWGVCSGLMLPGD